MAKEPLIESCSAILPSRSGDFGVEKRSLKVTFFQEMLQVRGPASGKTEPAVFQCRLFVTQCDQCGMSRCTIGNGVPSIEESREVCHDGAPLVHGVAGPFRFLVTIARDFRRIADHETMRVIC